MYSLDFLRKRNIAAQAELMRTARGLLRSVTPHNVDRSWAERVPVLERLLISKQAEMALRSAVVAPLVVAADGAHIAPAGMLNTLGFSGVVFGDVPVREALMSPARTYQRALDNGLPVRDAELQARTSLDRLMKTIAADTARSAMGTSVAVRPGMGYVRMVNPPVCSRCLILAGRFYRWNQGFRRHPNCDCVHLPTVVSSYEEALNRGLVTDPYEVFRNMGEDEQDRVFGRWSAQAIRDGADMFQVVNARMGRRGDLTVSGLGKRAWARRNRPQIVRYGRLTPEAIYLRAKSREHAIRMLDRAGYILPVGQVPTGGVVGQRIGFGQFGHGGAWRGGVNERILAALNSGVRDPLEVATMTAAERRMFEAARDYEWVQKGIHPYSETALVARGAPRIGAAEKALTPEIAAEFEAHYYLMMHARGEKVEFDRLWKLTRGRKLKDKQKAELYLLHEAGTAVVQEARRAAFEAREGLTW